MEKHLLELTEYTDPYCTWCWGSEPILRRIEEVYGNQVKISFKMGGLVEDMRHFHDPANQIGGSAWYEQVASHWLDASNRHGMPVDEQVFFDIKDQLFSTYPANIAYKAAQCQDVVLANLFLRRMREGAAAGRKVIQLLNVQVELAEDVGLVTKQFIDDIESGKAKKAFAEDLTESRSRGIRSFPSFLIRNLNNKEEEIVLEGYRQFEEFAGIFQKFAGDTLKRLIPQVSRDSIFTFVRKYNKVAAKEITEVFELKAEETDEYLTALVSEGLLSSERAGNGYFYAAPHC